MHCKLTPDDPVEFLSRIGYASETILAWFSSWEVLGFDGDSRDLDRCYEVSVSYPEGERPDVLSEEKIRVCDIEAIRTDAVVERVIKDRVLAGVLGSF